LRQLTQVTTTDFTEYCTFYNGLQPEFFCQCYITLCRPIASVLSSGIYVYSFFGIFNYRSGRVTDNVATTGKLLTSLWPSSSMIPANGR